MIISHKFRFIFLRTRKTAGTSIEIALSKFCGKDDVITPVASEDEAIRRKLRFRGPQNYLVPLRDYSLEDFKSLFFPVLGNHPRRAMKYKNHLPASVVRQRVGEVDWNSYFTFCFERNPYDKAISRYYWSTRNQPQRPSMEAYFDRVSHHLLSNWEIYTINDELAVDFVGRYETLQDDLDCVAEKIGLPERLSLPMAKGGHRKNYEPYSQVLSPGIRHRIDQVCARELQAFGYRWEQQVGPFG